MIKGLDQREDLLRLLGKYLVEPQKTLPPNAHQNFLKWLENREADLRIVDVDKPLVLESQRPFFTGVNKKNRQMSSGYFLRPI